MVSFFSTMHIFFSLSLYAHSLNYKRWKFSQNSKYRRIPNKHGYLILSKIIVDHYIRSLIGLINIRSSHFYSLKVELCWGPTWTTSNLVRLIYHFPQMLYLSLYTKDRKKTINKEDWTASLYIIYITNIINNTHSENTNVTNIAHIQNKRQTDGNAKIKFEAFAKINKRRINRNYVIRITQIDWRILITLF